MFSLQISEAAATDLVAPNPLQRAVLFWSFQQAAHASRVEGVVGEGWGEGRGEEEEENFSPTIYRQFDKNTIHAPLLWYMQLACRHLYVHICMHLLLPDSNLMVG